MPRVDLPDWERAVTEAQIRQGWALLREARNRRGPGAVAFRGGVWRALLRIYATPSGARIGWAERIGLATVTGAGDGEA